jgi:hypothetical protein
VAITLAAASYSPLRHLGNQPESESVEGAAGCKRSEGESGSVHHRIHLNNLCVMARSIPRYPAEYSTRNRKTVFKALELSSVNSDDGSPERLLSFSGVLARLVVVSMRVPRDGQGSGSDRLLIAMRSNRRQHDVAAVRSWHAHQRYSCTRVVTQPYSSSKMPVLETAEVPEAERIEIISEFT